MRVGMTKGRIDDAVVGDTKHKFTAPNAREAVILGQKAIVCRVVEIEDILQMNIVVGNAREYAVMVAAVFRRYQPMRIELPD